MQNLVGLGVTKQRWWDFWECSGKEYHIIIQFILCWNRKQGLDCFRDQFQALSQVVTGWISWSPFLSWQHPRFILNKKFCQSVHVFQLLCEILVANLFEVFPPAPLTQPTLLIQEMISKAWTLFTLSRFTYLFFFSIETLSSSYINVGVFENYESLQFSYQTTPTQVNSSSSD